MPLPSIEQKVAFLSRPEAYPAPTRRVETKETHMAWVFLTERRAWKLKKPARYEFLDFSTLEARRKDCEEELRLNRRLAPDVYYGLAPLTIDPQGGMRLVCCGTGYQPVPQQTWDKMPSCPTFSEEIIDWLVEMRRLPDACFLDRAIANRTVSATDARKVGALLAGFYKQAPPVEMTASEYRKRLTDDIKANQRELANPDYALPADSLEAITEAQLKFLDQRRELFDERARDGKIIEAHGDLRPEHICLESEPVIIDCLEFNRDFRILDTASELAFLALECERLGAPEVGDQILEACEDETGDRAPAQLMAFYKSYHACLRAKIAVWHLRDHKITDVAKWTGKARHYLSLAAPLISVF
jgi:aminoglycoside phosphotransferase family enzyme